MNIVLFDDQNRPNLLPIAFTRPVADIRVGITTIRDKWEAALGQSTSSKTETYLSIKYPLVLEEENLFVNGAVFPSSELLTEILGMELNTALLQDEILIAAKIEKEDSIAFGSSDLQGLNISTYAGKITKLSALWDIFSLNGQMIDYDFERLTTGKKSQPVSDTNSIIGSSLFIEAGAKVEYCTINTEEGPVYIGKNAEIMEGCLIRGPFALCENSTVKMGAKVYGPTTVGPHSKIGGEVTNCVIQAYSNKGHDGFLGNSVIGKWCNLGADTNNSNLKNNYSDVSIWNYTAKGYKTTGLQFCGLIMGDHSKSGINAMFNTGTVVGVSANIFGSGFPDKFIPSFSWGGAEGFSGFEIEKAKEVAAKMYERRGLKFDKQDQDIMDHLFEITKEYRS